MSATATPFLERLDRAQLNAFHWRLLVLAGIGSLLAGADVTLAGAAVVTIAGTLVGALSGGRAADSLGRRTLLFAALVLIGAGAAVSAIAPTAETLATTRFVLGLGVGCGLPAAMTLLGEFSPRATRGRSNALLGVFVVFGVIGAWLAASFASTSVAGVVVGLLTAVYAAYLRSALPESPRYLAERGRAAEADAVVRRVERAGGGALLTLERAVALTRSGRTSLADVFGPRYIRRTVMLWILWLALAFVYVNVPVEPIVLLAQLLGFLSAAWLVERAGRKPALIGYLLGSAAAAFLVTATGVGTAYAALGFFVAGAFGALFACTVELYPTATRSTGAGLAVAAGSIGAALVAFITPVVGQSAFAIAPLVAAAAVFLLAAETRGNSLEEISPVAP